MRGFLTSSSGAPSIAVSSIGVACTAALALPLLALPAGAVPARPSGAGVPGRTHSLPLVPLSRERVLGTAPEQGLYRPDGERFSLVGVVWDDPDTELHGRVQVRTRSAVTGKWSGWQDVETHTADHGADPGAAERDARRARGATAPLWVGESGGVDVRVRADGTGAPGRRTAGPLSPLPPWPPLPSGLRLELVDPGTEPPPDGASGGGTGADGASVGGASAGGAGSGGASAGGASAGGAGAGSASAGGAGVGGASVGGASAGGAGSGGASAGGAGAGSASAGSAGAEGDGIESAGVDGTGGEGAGGDGATADAPGTGAHAGAAWAASDTNADIAGFGALEIPALDKQATEQELVRLQGPSKTKPHIGPRPRIVTRRGWDADESLRQDGFVYTKKIKAAFVHHTASGNNYTCSEAPSVVRSIYRYHVESMGWRDIGYNFLVDKCGTIYEGRAGGVAKAVLGAHTRGFNTNSMGIAVIGTFGATKPSGAAVTAIARLTAWKLGLYGANPRGKTYLTSGGGNLYPKGKNVRLNVISGHRDGFATECPGKRLYAKLGTARSSAARYQGR
ncbi:peptidoglycan recognition protein family protein [Streptomyces sp. NPDC001709]